jgi:uncharacterized protein YndB with AHSA1/START domain
MELVALALVAVAVLVGAFVFLRRGGATAETRVSIEIDAPPEAVFAWVDSDDRVLQWVGGLKRIEPLEASPAGPGAPTVVGRRERLFVEVDGREMVMESEVTSFRRNEEIGQRMTAGAPLPFVEDITFRLVPVAGGRTRFEVRATTRYTSWLGGLMEPFLNRAGGRKLTGDLERLKSLVEGRAAAAT